MDGGSLDHFMKFNNGIYSGHKRKARLLPESALAAIAFQILFALAYLHEENVLHRDIKPANILINSKGFVKISDLGISGLVSSARLDATSSGLNHTVIGTSIYMSPERVLDKAYSFPSDIWSFGLVLIECATGGWSPLLSGERSSDGHQRGISSIIELAMILNDFSIDQALVNLSHEQSIKETHIKSSIHWDKELSESGGLSELIRWSLQKVPEKRIPAMTLLQSPWFAKHKIIDVMSAQKGMSTYLI